MTTVASPCTCCKHFDIRTVDKDVCAAFPKGIPLEIFIGKNDHQTPYPGDHGVMFEPIKGFEYRLRKAE